MTPEMHQLAAEMLTVLPLRLETMFGANACRLMDSDLNVVKCLEQDAIAQNNFSPFGTALAGNFDYEKLVNKGADTDIVKIGDLLGG
jgi:hypothetical protein